MSTARVEELSSHARWEGERGRCASPKGGVLWVGDRWDSIALLLAALEADLMRAAVDAIRNAKVPLLYYESSAMVRIARDTTGERRLLDVIVRPRVGVQTPNGGDAVRRILETVTHSWLGHTALNPAARLEPVIEAWAEPPPQAWEQH